MLVYPSYYKWARIGLTFAPAIPILKNILNPEFKTNKLRHNSLRAARNRSAFHAVSFPRRSWRATPPSTWSGWPWAARPWRSSPRMRAGRHRAGPAARPVGARHGRGRHRLDRPARTRHRPLRRQHPRRHRASAGRRRGLGAGAADRNRRRRPARAGRQPLPAARQPLGRRRTAAAGRRRRHAGSRHAGLGRPDDRDRGRRGKRAGHRGAARDRLSVHRHWRSVPVARLLRSRRDRARLRAGLAAARAHGLPCGIYTGSAEAARQAHGQGYRMAVAASDIDLLKQGLQSALAAAPA